MAGSSPAATSKGAEAPAFDDAPWRSLDLPHDWSIEGPFSRNEAAGNQGAYLPTGIGWYRKTFSLPETCKDKQVSIEFDGVYQDSEVWINGHSLGKRPFGYVSFAYDLTEHLKFDGPNVLAVRVDNSVQTNSRWYSGSGIYRHVWLLATGKVHVDRWGTFATTPQVSKESATVRIETRVKNEGKNNVKFTLATDLFDKEGKVVKGLEMTSESVAGGVGDFVTQFVVDRPNLWSVDAPYLYRLQTTLKEQDRILDQYDTPLGVREVRYDADKGCLINGRHVKLNGVCLHHDGGSVGAAVPERVWQRRLETLREMGCNAIRTSHNPPAPEFLDLCDKLGFLVMDEAFDEWRVPKIEQRYAYHVHFDEWWERDVRSMVLRDRNHPSVAMWSAGNEVPDQIEPDGAATLKKLLDVFHKLDPTRLVTVGCDRIVAEPKSATPEFLALLDIVGYNYVRPLARAEGEVLQHRQAGLPQTAGGRHGKPLHGRVRGDYASRRGANPDVEQLWKFVGTYDYVIGDFMWTGIDYLGEARWPSKNSTSGVLDTCGFKKDGFYFYQSQWTAKPMVHLFPHWNWPGKEGQVIPVTCYTNCDTRGTVRQRQVVGSEELRLPALRDGRRLRALRPPGSQRPRTTSDLHLTWDAV